MNGVFVECLISDLCRICPDIRVALFKFSQNSWHNDVNQVEALGESCNMHQRFCSGRLEENKLVCGLLSDKNEKIKRSVIPMIGSNYLNNNTVVCISKRIRTKLNNKLRNIITNFARYA
ncbi:hypothetical protein LSH36_254g01019 [Paralvinella palmiformis]|uniref:Uncharacterized protein n=1 Tax=Paralvinella palmiformis TaxID=53620 RepID=A0AAD9JMR5_9ANNE|nr:hypothetical protein LSH36_254g01019 [Paralvinella palmiformis]